MERAVMATGAVLVLLAVVGGVLGFFWLLGWIFSPRAPRWAVPAAFVVLLGILWIEMFFAVGSTRP